MSFLEDLAPFTSLLLRAGLADLLAQHFAGVADALVLVRIGRAQRADIGRHLAQHLLVVAGQHQVRLLVDLQIDAVGQQNFDGVRIAERERRDLALDVGAVADADDVELARESGRDALHGIGGQRARQPVQRGVLIGCRARVRACRRPARRVMPCGNRNRQLALGTFHLQLFADR